MTESFHLFDEQRAQWTRMMGIPVNPYGERDPYPWDDASSIPVDLTKGEGF